MLIKEELERFYFVEGHSMQQTAEKFNCSVNKVVYWMDRYKLARRTRSDANYLLYNPNGDPFQYKKPDTPYLQILYGMGLGIYWGEGTKANKNSVRVGNTDVYLIQTFLEFLIKIYSIDQSKLRFSLQLFDDIDPDEALEYWISNLGYVSNQFSKPHITKSIRKGTYGKRSKYGVLTLHFHNTKLRNILIDSLPKNGVKYKTG